jgi:hypothetical protein
MQINTDLLSLNVVWDACSSDEVIRRYKPVVFPLSILGYMKFGTFEE